MTTLSYFPVVTDETQLIDILSRAGWFLTACPIDRIYVPVSSLALTMVEWRVAPGMDPAIAEKFCALRERLQFVLAEKAGDLDDCMTQANIILHWKKGVRPRFVSAETQVAWEKGKKVWQVDPATVRMEGSFYIDVGLFLQANKPSLIEENSGKFCRLKQKLGKFERAYLMATGPSVAQYRKFDYHDALKIVCNSVILDENLMDFVRPQILVFADPIFHFGPSQYAASFRSKLLESSRKYDYVICIPFKYYGLFVAALPELADRTIGIPFVKDREFNFDLAGEFMLKTTANILTFLMIPLAATFADEIGFLGCDGRPLKDNTYFWNHNPQTQFNDKMVNIREVHPGFFDIDYNDYYLEHCQTLENQLLRGEVFGKKFVSLTFSHIPAFQARLGRGARIDRSTAVEGEIKAILIDPDAIDQSGHFMAYNDKLCTALEARGLSVTVLCNKSIADEILTQREKFNPKLSTFSWLYGRADSDYHPRRFKEEILCALNELWHADSTILLYMYCGSLEHAKAFGHVTRQHPNVYVNINLFWLSFRNFKDAEWVAAWHSYFRWLDDAAPRIVATVPTREI